MRGPSFSWAKAPAGLRLACSAALAFWFYEVFTEMNSPHAGHGAGILPNAAAGIVGVGALFQIWKGVRREHFRFRAKGAIFTPPPGSAGSPKD